MRTKASSFEKGRMDRQEPYRKRGWWPLSHRSKIVAWAFIPASLILGAVALVAFFAYRQITAELVMERDLQLIQVAALQVAGEVEDEAAPLDQLARSLAVHSDVALVQQLPPALAEEAFLTFEGGVILLDAAGRIVLSEPRRPTLTGEDWSAQPFFQDAREQGRLVYSNLISSPSGEGGQPMHSVAISSPIMGPTGAFRGAIVGFIRLDRPDQGPFADSVLNLSKPGNRQIVLVDGTGYVLLHPDGSQIGADYGDVPSVQRLLAGSDGALRATNADGEEVVTAYAEVPGSRWGLVAEETWSSLLAPYSAYQQLMLFLLILGLVAPAVVVLAGVRRLMRPLQALTAATQAVARGEFGREIAVHSGDEIEMLAHHFNVMSSELAALYARQDAQLSARTRELQALNAIAAAVSHTGGPQKVLGLALDEALDVVGMEAGGVFLLEEDSQELSLVAGKGLDTRLLGGLGAMAEWQEFAESIVDGGEPVLLSDWRNDKLLAPQNDEIYTLGGFPIRASGRALGALCVLTSQTKAFTTGEVALLTSIGQQIGVAVENSRLLQQVQESAAEEERQRLARELHDAVSQTLFSASLIAEALPRLWEKDQAMASARLDELRALSRGALAEMRTLLLELRPAVLTASPLPDLLRQLIDAMRGRSRLQMALVVEGAAPPDRLPADVQIALYRIAQEALNNIVKHAEATRVKVDLAFGPAGVLLDIYDDGKGFDTSPGQNGARGDSFGLSIMRERAMKIGADIQIDSTPGGGTRVTVVAPLPKK